MGLDVEEREDIVSSGGHLVRLQEEGRGGGSDPPLLSHHPNACHPLKEGQEVVKILKR